ncbi:hypothetical protein EV687_0933 [Corticibacter populi]|nr:hypothetical protein EV687_0933 [Corticibacter populi]
MKPIRSTAPPYSLQSPAFRYTPADRTDIRETFRRIRQTSMPMFKQARQ